ncbi:MAG: DNA ligase [Chloroflexi bacterium]|nr:MAG: DNA ligase [Chloroflexota bacterium]
MNTLYKYPRTQHIEGSGLQAGDDDQGMVPYQALAGRHLVVEEKMDGANSAISFTKQGKLLLQSRGHYLTGGPRERHFALLKAWASRYTTSLWDLLGDRYVMYGEWLYARHTIFYTDLPHYFLEFDILDTQTSHYLDTPRRQALLASTPFIQSVRVLHAGVVPSYTDLIRMAGPSAFISAHHLEHLRQQCARLGIDPGTAVRETDPTTLMEGLYIKAEKEGTVTDRYKYVRAGFLQTVFDAGSHWLDRPIIANQLRSGVELF